MDNILVVGAGGVSHVTVHKMAQNPNYFKNIILANDLEFEYSVNSPTIMIEGMTVAGKWAVIA